jgi:hypothetical protein
MNTPTPAGVDARMGGNVDADLTAKTRAGEADSALNVRTAQVLPGVASRETDTKTRAVMTALLQLCPAGIWLYSAWRLFRQAHPLLASALLLVALCQVCARLRAGGKHRTALPQGATRFPRKRGKSAPWHSVRQTLLENDFNERVSVMMPPTVHVCRHAERAGKEDISSDR